jgi:MFS family permease
VSTPNATDHYRYVRSFFSPEEIRRGLGLSILASAIGIVFYSQVTVGSLLFTGFALALGVSIPMMSVLTCTMPLASFAEIIGSWVVRRTGHRREVFMWGQIICRVMWIPVVLIPFVISDRHPDLRIATLFALLVTASVIGIAGGNAWNSWMGDLVPKAVLGRFWGIRQMLTVPSGLVAGILVGLYLDHHLGFGGYVAVVAVLLVFGIVDVLLFRWVPHPPVQTGRADHPLLDLIQLPLRDPRYRRIITFIACWTFASGLMGSYGMVFIKDSAYAGMSFTKGNVCIAIGGLFQMTAAYLFGRLADRWSAKKVLLISLLTSVTPPFYYLFADSQTTWPVFAAWCVGSVAWGGIFVVSVQMTFGAAPAKDRSVFLACYAAVMGIVTAAAFLAGGGIVKLLSGVEISAGPWVWRDLHILFVIVGLLRLACIIPLMRLEDNPHRVPG